MVSKTPSGPFEADDLAATAKTYVALLTEGALRNESQPQFESRGTSTLDPENTFCLCITMRTQDPIVKNIAKTAYGRNKKTTKHRAAKAMLLEIIELCDDYYVWGIPGKDKETAKEWIEQLMPELAAGGSVNSSFETAVASDGTDLTSNAVGRLAQMCTKYSLPVPEYVETKATVTGDENTFTFTMAVNCGDATTEGTAKSKKTAKNLAAAEMYKMLLEIQEEQRLQHGIADSALENAAVDELANVSEASEMPTPAVSMTPRLSREYVLDGDSNKENDAEGDAITLVKTTLFDGEYEKETLNALELLENVCEQEPRLLEFDVALCIQDEYGMSEVSAVNNVCLKALEIIQSLVYNVDALELEEKIRKEAAV